MLSSTLTHLFELLLSFWKSVAPWFWIHIQTNHGSQVGYVDQYHYWSTASSVVAPSYIWRGGPKIGAADDEKKQYTYFELIHYSFMHHNVIRDSCDLHEMQSLPSTITNNWTLNYCVGDMNFSCGQLCSVQMDRFVSDWPLCCEQREHSEPSSVTIKNTFKKKLIWSDCLPPLTEIQDFCWSSVFPRLIFFQWQ